MNCLIGITTVGLILLSKGKRGTAAGTLRKLN